LLTLRTAKNQFDEAAEKTAVKMELAGQINSQVAALIAAQRGVIMYSFGKDSERTTLERRDFNEKTTELSKTIDTLEAMVVTEEGKKLAVDMKQNVATWKEVFGEVDRLCLAGQSDAGLKVGVARTRPIFEGLKKAATRTVEMQRENLRKAQEEAAGRNSIAMTIAFSLIALSIVSVVLGCITVKRVSALLDRIVSELSDGAGQVSSAASQVSSSAQALAQGSSEQAATLEETSASSTEINTMTQKNAENCRTVAGLMDQSTQRVAQANIKLKDMMKSMEDIRSSSTKISNIIKVIDEIAFQTNLLALNAAVEAARAGESGMGFAVVADEVRNLAQRCAQAAKDTAQLIEDSIAKSGEGGKRLDEVADAVHEITGDSEKIRVLVADLNAATGEQAKGISQVVEAIAQIEHVTQSSAASAEESASASEELTAQAEAMSGIAIQLQEVVRGTSAMNNHSRAPQPSTPPPAARKSSPRAAGAAGLTALRKAVNTGRGRSPVANRPAAAAIPLTDGEFSGFEMEK
jgi:methyl-accepting chemotaxis protein/methyl-accepting chemotaxis protein-1 (serine sensor receptor)